VIMAPRGEGLEETRFDLVEWIQLATGRFLWKWYWTDGRIIRVSLSRCHCISSVTHGKKRGAPGAAVLVITKARTARVSVSMATDPVRYTRPCKVRIALHLSPAVAFFCRSSSIDLGGGIITGNTARRGWRKLRPASLDPPTAELALCCTREYSEITTGSVALYKHTHTRRDNPVVLEDLKLLRLGGRICECGLRPVSIVGVLQFLWFPKYRAV
jgi:hypothetical protein